MKLSEEISEPEPETDVEIISEDAIMSVDNKVIIKEKIIK